MEITLCLKDCTVCVCVCRFVLAAVSPAVVVPSMLLLQREGYGVEKVNHQLLLNKFI